MRISDWSSDVCSSDLHVADRSPPSRLHHIRIGLGVLLKLRMADMPHLNGGFRQNRLVHTSHYSLTKGFRVGRRAWEPNYHCHLFSTAETLLRTSITSPHTGFTHDGPSVGAPRSTDESQ